MKKFGKYLCLTLSVLLLVTACKKKSNDNKILSFSFASINAEITINENEKSIEAVVPMNTNVANLVPMIEISENASINPASGTVVDFTNPVLFTVTAESGLTATYIVKVIVRNDFLGTWGVEKIEYYNIDFFGQPIEASYSIFEFDPYDIDNGIQLVFREDRTGEMRDSAVDTLWFNDGSIIVCPDTTIVNTFTYSFDELQSTLFMKMDYAHTFSMTINEMSLNSFVYVNEYEENYVEKAYLKRLSATPTKTKSSIKTRHPKKPGSLLGGMRMVE